MLRQYDTSYDLNVLITLRVSRRDYDGRVTAHIRGCEFGKDSKTFWFIYDLRLKLLSDNS